MTTTATTDQPKVPVPGVPGLVVRSGLLDTAYVADVFGIPASTLERMVTAGQVPHVKLGKHTRFTPGHLGEIIAQAERRPEHYQPAAAQAPSAPDIPTSRRSTARTKL